MWLMSYFSLYIGVSVSCLIITFKKQICSLPLRFIPRYDWKSLSRYLNSRILINTLLCDNNNIIVGCDFRINTTCHQWYSAYIIHTWPLLELSFSPNGFAVVYSPPARLQSQLERMVDRSNLASEERPAWSGSRIIYIFF